MLTKKYFAGFFVPLLLSGSFVIPGAAGGEEPDEPEKNLLELAAEAGDFDMFLRAIEETELREKLEGDGPFTVFAPSDDAFDLLEMELIDMLLHPSREHYRTRLLGNHIVEGEIRSQDNLGEGEQELETLAGTTLSYVSEQNHFYLETARIQESDMEASNGVLHRIDRIVVPQY